jgi:mannose-6-phosphate isomerase-like protein (cupin superfamily)
MSSTPSSAVGPDLKLAQVRGVLLPMSCEELEPTLSFLVARLGFRLDSIFPADEPHTAILSGHGLGIRLARGAEVGVGQLDLLCNEPPADPQQARITAPNGVVFRLVAAEPEPRSPVVKQELVLSRAAGAAGVAADWGTGRAGLRYRDLLPKRHGGAFIVSHIRLVNGGPVPDYVHFHKLGFQIIYARRGWVRVVYEDQGPPFVMVAGDCVLQPPQIRHRVLESSAGAEVIEMCAPAEHPTMVEHAITLPTATLRPERLFGGQRFVRHVAAQATWKTWRVEGYEVRDTGIGAASAGVGGVRVLRRAVQVQADRRQQRHNTEFCLYFMLAGRLGVRVDGRNLTLGEDDSLAIPGGMAYAFENASDDLELLELTLPAAFTCALEAD